jgi:hypothetical protein
VSIRRLQRLLLVARVKSVRLFESTERRQSNGLLVLIRAYGDFAFPAMMAADAGLVAGLDDSQSVSVGTRAV